VGLKVSLCGWVQKIRDKGKMIWIDLRDRYGVTQLIFQKDTTSKEIYKMARECGREFVLKASGIVSERAAKNKNLDTGDVEIVVESMKFLNKSKVPPFIIEDNTDGGEELRMKYRYLDLRRTPLQKNLKLRHSLMRETRNYLDKKDFVEIETPVLIKSTPEGARDFVVPSRMNQGDFYALPQSPQTFKQLLMVSGFDKYYQLVKCFRDEDLRADRQPEFTQIDCELSFAEREDVLETFGGLISHLFQSVLNVEIGSIPIMEYDDAIKNYGTDKPDIRFQIKINEISDVAKGNGFNVFDASENVLALVAPGCSEYSRKQLDELADFVCKPQIGAKGLVHIKCNEDGTFKSSVDKFFEEKKLGEFANACKANQGDLILVLAGEKNSTYNSIAELRLEMGDRLNLRDSSTYKPVWVVNFPLVKWDEESKRFHAMHHPFTSPLEDDIDLLEKDPASVRANAYDLVVNGIEIGGGSIRIYKRELQEKMFKVLGFTKKEAEEQFGFLLDAFQYGTPPHGGIAFGFDRICALFGGKESIRDFIAFPKNTSGRDVMIDSPSNIDSSQRKELGL